MTRIDWFLASDSFMTHVLNADIGVAYGSDHSPIYLEFTLEVNEWGRGFWKLPEFLVHDEGFQERVKDQIKLIQDCTQDANPALLWDTVKASIRGTAIKYLSEGKRKRKSQVESLEAKIAEQVLIRDNTHDEDSIIRYDDKIKYLQIELDEVFRTVSESSRKYNMARKYYYSDICSKYFLRSKVYKCNAIKMLHGDNEEVRTSDREILHQCYQFYNGLYTKHDHVDAHNTGLLAKFLNCIPGDKMSLSSFQLLGKDIYKGGN